MSGRTPWCGLITRMVTGRKISRKSFTVRENMEKYYQKKDSEIIK